jgi:hypothetical protein
VDIEGEEVNLLGSVKKGSVERICVETHPHITGKAAITNMIKSLESNGFNHDVKMSSGDTIYFH